MPLCGPAPGCVRSGSACLVGQAADLSVAQAVVDEAEDPAGCRHLRDSGATTSRDAVVVGGVLGPPRYLAAASMVAQRTKREPALVMRPRRTLVSDSLCLGVSPAHEHRASAERKRETSPISATKMAPVTGPTPLMLGWLDSRGWL
jgi:hypothetical protein